MAASGRHNGCINKGNQIYSKVGGAGNQPKQLK